MNKEQIEGVAKDIAGKVQEGAGKIIGSKEQQAKGLEKQVEGQLEKKVGDAREVIEDTVKKITNP
ncbi:CsbD family protein [Undibacterium sp. Ji42W]|uniref:CsbD family protein n=1 Tax=Undibacterium sp. Ji42W TaxID=3413039 RepID=UPI003BEFEC65